MSKGLQGKDGCSKESLTACHPVRARVGGARTGCVADHCAGKAKPSGGAASNVGNGVSVSSPGCNGATGVAIGALSGDDVSATMVGVGVSVRSGAGGVSVGSDGAVGVGVSVGSGVAVGAGVSVGSGVAVGAGVSVGAGVGVGAAVGVGVSITTGVGVSAIGADGANGVAVGADVGATAATDGASTTACPKPLTIAGR